MPRQKSRRAIPAGPIPHGTRTGYTNYRCGCRPCTDANSEGQRRTRLKQFYGTYDKFVPVKPVRDHLLVVQAAGISLRQISQTSGVSRNTLNEILRQRTTRTWKTTAERVLAVSTDPMQYADTGHVLVPAVGAVRRLQALNAIGWSGAALAERLGVDRIALNRYTRGQYRRMPVSLVRRIAELYERLWNQPRDDSRARAYAERCGWVSPLAWDDDTIDDPDALPDTGEVVPSNRGHFEDMVWLLESGAGWETALTRAGYSSLHAAVGAARRHGRRDIMAMLPDPHVEKIVLKKSA